MFNIETSTSSSQEFLNECNHDFEQLQKIARIRKSIQVLTNELTKAPKGPAVSGRKPYTLKSSRKVVRSMFPQKVAQLANGFNHREYIRWSRKSWIVAFKSLEFEDKYLRNEELSRSSKHPITTQLWSSFVRQLNNHGFRKIRGQRKIDSPMQGPWSFYQRFDRHGHICPIGPLPDLQPGLPDQCVPSLTAPLAADSNKENTL